MRTDTAKRRAGRSVVVLCLLTAVVSACAPAGEARGESIWSRRTSNDGFLFTDNVAAEVGDSLTVLVTEASSFTKKGERDLSKSSAHSGQASLKTNGEDVFSPVDLSEQSSRSFKSSNNYTSERQFVDSVTVTVVDRLPNGNLVVAGRTERRVEEEEIVTMLTGIVKPEDVSGGNTVSSNRVASLRIYHESRGPSDRYMRPGLLGWIIGYLWPF